MFYSFIFRPHHNSRAHPPCRAKHLGNHPNSGIRRAAPACPKSGGKASPSLLKHPTFCGNMCLANLLFYVFSKDFQILFHNNPLIFTNWEQKYRKRMKQSSFFPTFLCFGIKKMLYIIKMLFFRAFYETEVQYLNHFL